MSDLQGGPAPSAPPGSAPAPAPGSVPPVPPRLPPLPVVAPVDRLYAAWQRRGETDYVFDFWTALGWTVLTLGGFWFYVLFQLVRRLRDHNARRRELLGAALSFAWEQAWRRGVADELTPSFERAAAHLEAMGDVGRDGRDPAVWLVLSVVSGGLLGVLAFALMDRDLIAHDRTEAAVEYELWSIFGRLGVEVPGPDARRVKGPDRYGLRILALVASAGLYGLWWLHDQMAVPDRHFRANWYHEDVLAAAVQALR